jgi:hypothetical protein
MSDSDRTAVKKFQKGQFLGIKGVSDAASIVNTIHQHARDFLKTGTENAATNVDESPMFTTGGTRVLKRFNIAPKSNVASDNTDYVVFKIFKRINSTSTLVAFWNTHGGANGALTELNRHAANVVTNSDATVASSSSMTYKIEKYGAGQQVDPGLIFSFAMEDI